MSADKILPDDAPSPVFDVLRREYDKIVFERDSYLATCLAFEARYQIDSDSFMAAWNRGEMGDSSDQFNWHSAKRGLDIANMRLAFVMSGLALEDDAPKPRYADPNDDPDYYGNHM